MRIFSIIFLCFFLLGCGNSEEKKPASETSVEKENRISDFKQKTLLDLVKEQKDPLRAQLETKMKKAMKHYLFHTPDEITFNSMMELIDHRAAGRASIEFQKCFLNPTNIDPKEYERLYQACFEYFLQYANKNKIDLDNFTKEQKQAFSDALLDHLKENFF